MCECRVCVWIRRDQTRYNVGGPVQLSDGVLTFISLPARPLVAHLRSVRDLDPYNSSNSVQHSLPMVHIQLTQLLLTIGLLLKYGAPPSFSCPKTRSPIQPSLEPAYRTHPPAPLQPPSMTAYDWPRPVGIRKCGGSCIDRRPPLRHGRLRLAQTSGNQEV